MATKRDFTISYGIQADKSGAGTNTLVVDSVNDRVGIATGATTPAATLDVNGNIIVSGGDINSGAAVTSTLFGTTTTAAIRIGGALTTGTLTLGSANGSGTVAIGNTGTAAAQAVNIATSTTGTITIGGTGATAVQLPTGKTKVGQTFLLQGGAVNITLPSSAGTLYASGNTDVALLDGGTGRSITGTPGSVAYVATTTTMNQTAVGTAGQALVSEGAAAPSFQTLTLENLPDAWIKRTVKASTTADLITGGQVSQVSATTITGPTGASAVVFPAQDGVTINLNDRILVKNQNTTVQNGIYTLTTVGVAATTAWVLTRAADADTTAKLSGATVSIGQGTTQGGFIYNTNFETTGTVGTTACNFNRILDTEAVSGDATVVNSGALTIANSAVTFAKMQNINTARVLGRTTAAVGVIEELAVTGTGNVVFSTSPVLTTPTLGVATATSINKVTISAPNTSATLTLATGSTLATAGAFSLTLTSSATTNATFPSGTVTLASLAGTETLTNKTIPGRSTALNAAATLTAAQVQGGFIYSTPIYTAGFSLTAPTGTTLDTITTTTDEFVDLTIITLAAFAVTLAVNTGVTIVGTAATGATANSFATFRFRRTSTAATWIAYRIG